MSNVKFFTTGKERRGKGNKSMKMSKFKSFHDKLWKSQISHNLNHLCITTEHDGTKVWSQVE